MSGDDEPTRAGEGAPAEAATGARATDEQEQAYQDDFATTALKAVPRSDPAPTPTPTEAPPPAGRPPGATRATSPPARKKRRFPVKGLLVTLVLLAIVLAGAWVATRAVFFVGVDDQQVVTVYRGVPWELPAGVDLYTTHYTSGVTLGQIPPSRREAFTENKLRSLDDATDLVKQAELGKLRE